MNNSKQNGGCIEFAHLERLKPISSEFSSVGNEYGYARITQPGKLPAGLTGPLRLNDMTIILCRRGSFDVAVNLDHFKLEPDSILFIDRNSVLTIDNVDWDQIDISIFAMSTEFLRDINFEIGVMKRVAYNTQHHPHVKLLPDEMSTLAHYLDIIHYNASVPSESLYLRAISRCVIAALIYQSMSFAKRVWDRSPAPDTDHAALSRQMLYVKEFMQLLNDYHCTERTVSFYASRLYISPKYLSAVLRAATGRSAMEWIDQYVMLEAKNLLRFSDKNIQQIAYELNFRSQSAFGKYFKNQSGMTPSEFQRSE